MLSLHNILYRGLIPRAPICLRYTLLIYSVIQDKNIRVETNHCHTQSESPFLIELEKEIRNFLYANF